MSLCQSRVELCLTSILRMVIRIKRFFFFSEMGPVTHNLFAILLVDCFLLREL